MELETEYKGYKIRYNEVFEKFDVLVLKYDSEKLKDCKRYIDTYISKLNKIPRTKALLLNYNDTMEDVEVTSFDGKEYWVSYLNPNRRFGSKRGKESTEKLYMNNESNLKLISELKQKQGQIVKLDTEIKETINKLEHFKHKKESEV